MAFHRYLFFGWLFRGGWFLLGWARVPGHRNPTSVGVDPAAAHRKTQVLRRPGPPQLRIQGLSRPGTIQLGCAFGRSSAPPGFVGAGTPIPWLSSADSTLRRDSFPAELAAAASAPPAPNLPAPGPAFPKSVPFPGPACFMSSCSLRSGWGSSSPGMRNTTATSSPFFSEAA